MLSAIHVSMSSIEHAFTLPALACFFLRSSIKIANGAFHLPYQTRSKKESGGMKIAVVIFTSRVDTGLGEGGVEKAAYVAAENCRAN